MITFRTATILDAELISKLVNSAYRGESSKKGWTTEADLLGGQRTDAEKIQEMIEAKNSQIELSIDGEILGCVYLKVEENKTLYFGMLTVTPELQASGIGKLLLEHLEIKANEKGCTQIRMTVISIRKELIAFYERRGYKATGKTEPFPMNDPRFGIPKTPLTFLEFAKTLN
jgi:N-acetylglutamate synthase-like GNAT family acetyltransferase